MTENAPIYVTAADERYARCLHQILSTAHRRGWTKGAKWLVYDIGMTPDQRNSLTTRFPWAHWETLELDTLPPHYVPSLGTYAWKPEVIRRVVSSANGPVIWMDSANIPLSPPDAMLAHVRAHGLYLLRGQAPIMERCNPEVLERLGAPRWTWGMRECVTGIVGLDAGNPRIRQLVADWAKHAKDPETIRPKVRIERHMNDQAVMNALIAGPLCRGELVLTEEDVDISSGTPTRLLSTRNKLRPTLPLWAGRLAQLYYRLNKIFDQFAHRFTKGPLARHPLWRLRDEQSGLCYQIADGPKTCLKAPFGHAYSDPFLAEENGIAWAYFKDLNQINGRCSISAIPLIEPRGHATPALDLDRPVSFPALFRHQNSLYMLPEMEGLGRVELWRCSHFPAEWQRQRILLADVDASGSTIFAHAGRYWLMTSLASPFSHGERRYLAIFHSDDPVNGDWVAHPVNETGHDITLEAGSGRNAGNVIRHDGRLLRPVRHPSEESDAGLVAFREIVILTPDSFEERPVETPPGLLMSRHAGVRHLTCLDDITVWDRRTRP